MVVSIFATTTKESLGVGNAAAMREALKKVAESAAEIMERVRHKDGLAFNTANYIIGVAKTALADPPRNCDMFGGDFKMLHTAWFDWTGSPSGQNPDGTVKMTFAEWLLALVLTKGGAK